ncbi:MAG: DUF5320 domain-containing protein [Clostridiales bacterium]|nr:DUF5320 domain-containing protein [Clostridiales bacterium]
MPRGDGTGPMGMGSKTGRGAGYCNGFSTPGYANTAGFPGGFGCGFGRGRGFRRMYYSTGMPGWARYGAPVAPLAGAAAFDEKAFLRNQTEALEAQLQQLKQRMTELDKEDE